MWQIKTFLKCYEVPKYYVQGCLRSFLLLSKPELMIQVSKTSPIFAQKRKF